MPSPQLLVKFPSSKQWPGWHFSEYLLTNIDLGSPPTPNQPSPPATTSSSSTTNKLTTITINPHTSADYLADASVFTGIGTAPPLSAGPERTFAMKFAFRQDLIASLASEASIYVNHLHSLQGTVLPKFYGLFLGSPVMPRGKSVTAGFGLGMFSGDDDDSCGGGKAAGGKREGRYVEEDEEEEDKGVAACLVLEWWGKPVNRPFHVLPKETRFLIIDQLAALHRAGLYHGDFAERNVLMLTTTRAKPVKKSSRRKSKVLPAPPPIHASSSPSSSSHSPKQPEKSNSADSNSSESSCASSFFNLSVSECSSVTDVEEQEHRKNVEKTPQPPSSPKSSSTHPLPPSASDADHPEPDSSSENDEPEFTLETITEIRLIDFDIVLKHDFPCLACDVEKGRDFRVPFVPGELVDANALEEVEREGDGDKGEDTGDKGEDTGNKDENIGEKASVRGTEGGKRVHWGTMGYYSDEEEDGEDEEEDEEARAGREFGCQQMYDVCKHVMRVWG
ncbi:hypothetical protein BDV98DRAFT_268139 [Pterulicium gracile]|uniref:Uncharacterized protein n=1 Tax=Pterulicium gracile TaxID=1884261 RepID=A0A5C3Q5W9_9AGAR|nr:hypothetical protein BDV98DRAFT_268139 [Pterula gracilis]